jgi:hypothetical protein
VQLLTADILEEQYYMTYEFQRSNQLILKLSEMQHDLQIKRGKLEAEIMTKIGSPEE